MTKLSRNAESFEESKCSLRGEFSVVIYGVSAPEVFFAGLMVILPWWVHIRLICKPEMFLCRVFSPATAM